MYVKGKLLRVSVSWLGHPDCDARDLDEARNIVTGYCRRRGRPPVFGAFDKQGTGEGYYKFPVVWERANWWRKNDPPEKYEGCIVLIYEALRK